MGQDKLEEYLLRIADLVLDEEKIVTYKFVSRTLDVHVNTAKQLLYTFLIQQQKIRPCIVSATHLLAGLHKDGSYVVSIVSEDSLNEAYLKFDNITSEHIYSVQKGKSTGIEKSSHMLYVADAELKHSHCCTIKCDEPVKEDTSRMIPGITTQEIGSVSETIKDNLEKETKETIVKQSPSEGKKGNLISNFFNNQPQRIKGKTENSECTSGKVQNTSKNIDEVDLKELSIKEDKKRERGVTSKSNGVVPKKKTKINKEAKKRKRILSELEESESDEERRDAMLRVEAEVPESSEPLNTADDEDGDLFRHKKKKKKIVDRTFLREDNYLETTKEIVYETDSENESDSKNLNDPKANELVLQSSKQRENVKSKTVTSKNTGKKQQTLLSFFKKN